MDTDRWLDCVNECVNRTPAGIVVDKAGEALFDHLLRTSEDEKSGIFRKAEQRRGNRSKSHGGGGSASPTGNGGAGLKAVSVDHKDQRGAADADLSVASASGSRAASPRSPGGDSVEDLLAEIDALEQDAEVAFAKKVRPFFSKPFECQVCVRVSVARKLQVPGQLLVVGRWVLLLDWRRQVSNVQFKNDASSGDPTQNDYMAQLQSIGMGLGRGGTMMHSGDGSPGSSVAAQIAELQGSQLLPPSSNDALAALDTIEAKAALEQQRQQYLQALQCEGDHDVLTCGSTAAKRYGCVRTQWGICFE